MGPHSDIEEEKGALHETDSFHSPNLAFHKEISDNAQYLNDFLMMSGFFFKFTWALIRGGGGLI